MQNRPEGDDQQEDLDAPVPSIPDLKKKEKERKRTGVVWSGARPAGTPFAGATGGSGAAGVEVTGSAAQAAAASGAEAGALGGAAPGLAWLGGPGGWLGGASASLLGKAMIAIGVASLLAGAGLYAYLRQHAKLTASAAALGPLTQAIKVRRDTNDDRLRMAAQANHGQLLFDDAAPRPAEASAAAESSQPQAAVPAPEKPADNPWGEILSAVQSPHGFAQALAGLPSAADFGGHDIFPTLASSGARGANSPSLRSAGQKGKLSGAFAHGAASASRGSAMSTRFARSSRAFAQLRYARGLSLLAARGSGEQGMKTSAADAFEQTDTQGGQISQIDSPVAASPPGSGGASGGEYGGQVPSIPSDPYAPPPQQPTPPGSVDPGEAPYQGTMNAIQQLVAEAAQLKMVSMILIAAGIALIAAGCACMPFGWGLIAAGIALVAVGVMMLVMANKMAGEAQSMSNALQSAYGQQAQQQDVNTCIQQAIANGTPTSQCNTPYNDSNTGNAPTTVSQDVNAEQSSTFEIQDGQPASGKSGP